MGAFRLSSTIALLPLAAQLFGISLTGQTPAAPASTSESIPSPVALASVASPALLVPPAATLYAASASSSLSAGTPVPATLLPVATQFAAIFAVPCDPGFTLTGNPAQQSGAGAKDPEGSFSVRKPCSIRPNLYTRFLDTTRPSPLTPKQKAILALHDIKDPGNLATIFNSAAFTIAINSHTAYGPGWKGFGRDSGYSLLQDATGEAFGTFLIPSLTHEDPRYHRMANAPVPRRLLHAVSHTFLSQSDTGTAMPNFSTLLTYPIGAEIGNLYLPGVNDNGPSTAKRIVLGYATDPVDNVITEFLPDVARHIHVRILFAQHILNQVSSDQFSLP